MTSPRWAGTSDSHISEVRTVPDAGSAFEAARDLMQRRGFTYDFVSDRQLEAVRLDGTTLRPAAARGMRRSFSQ